MDVATNLFAVMLVLLALSLGGEVRLFAFQATVARMYEPWILIQTCCHTTDSTIAMVGGDTGINCFNLSQTNVSLLLLLYVQG